MTVRAKLLGSLLWCILWLPLSLLFIVHPHHMPTLAPLLLISDILPDENRSQMQEQALWNAQHIRWIVIPGATFWGVLTVLLVFVPSRVTLSRKIKVKLKTRIGNMTLES